jgi:hypothetical protein
LELGDNIVRNDQSKTNALSVHSLSILKFTKELEQLNPIFALDSDTGVFDSDHDFVLGFMGSVDLLYPMFIFEVSLVTVQRVFARVRRF